MGREERITQIVLHMFTHQMAERIVELEDQIKAQELDPERVESALRMYVAELDYDKHKYIMAPEDGGPDRYPEEADYFLRCWETAGEDN